jgi:hypothetical protein
MKRGATSGDASTACIRQHTSASGSIRQHTSAYVSAYVSIRQHTSAYMSAYVRIRQTSLPLTLRLGLSLSFLCATHAHRCLSLCSPPPPPERDTPTLNPHHCLLALSLASVRRGSLDLPSLLLLPPPPSPRLRPCAPAPGAPPPRRRRSARCCTRALGAAGVAGYAAGVAEGWRSERDTCARVAVTRSP